MNKPVYRCVHCGHRVVGGFSFEPCPECNIKMLKEISDTEWALQCKRDEAAGTFAFAIEGHRIELSAQVWRMLRSAFSYHTFCVGVDKALAERYPPPPTPPAIYPSREWGEWERARAGSLYTDAWQTKNRENGRGRVLLVLRNYQARTKTRPYGDEWKKTARVEYQVAENPRCAYRPTKVGETHRVDQAEFLQEFRPLAEGSPALSGEQLDWLENVRLAPKDYHHHLMWHRAHPCPEPHIHKCLEKEKAAATL